MKIIHFQILVKRWAIKFVHIYKVNLAAIFFNHPIRANIVIVAC